MQNSIRPGSWTCRLSSSSRSGVPSPAARDELNISLTSAPPRGAAPPPWLSTTRPRSALLLFHFALTSKCREGRAQTQAPQPQTRIFSCPHFVSCPPRPWGKARMPWPSLPSLPSLVSSDLLIHGFSQRRQEALGSETDGCHQNKVLAFAGSREERDVPVSLQSPNAMSPCLPLHFPFPQLSSLAAKRKSTLFIVAY